MPKRLSVILRCCPCRLYANASLAGAGLTVTSCGYTTAGDPVVSVVSSPNPAGPYTCVG